MSMSPRSLIATAISSRTLEEWNKTEAKQSMPPELDELYGPLVTRSDDVSIAVCFSTRQAAEAEKMGSGPFLCSTFRGKPGFTR